MPTGLILAINASQLLAGSAAESTAQHLRPAHFAGAQDFGAPRIVNFSPGVTQTLRPAHFAEAQEFGAPRLTPATVEAHRYWRVLISENNGSLFTTLGAILQMFAGYDRINLALSNAQCAASDAGVFGNVTAGLFDDDVTSKWAVAETGADWVSYDFGAPVAINGCRLQCPPTQDALMARDFAIQYSDDNASWLTLWSETGQVWVDYEGRFFWNPGYAPSYSGSPLTPARYWRVRCWTHTADTFTCAELIMAIAAAGSQQASGGSAFASNADFGAAANAFDANAATFWAPASAAGQSLGYDFGLGVTKALAEMRWKSRSAGAAGQNPQRATIEFSFDGALYHPLLETYNGVAWSDGEERTFADPYFL